jgi:hypothetical protein
MQIIYTNIVSYRQNESVQEKIQILSQFVKEGKARCIKLFSLMGDFQKNEDFV